MKNKRCIEIKKQTRPCRSEKSSSLSTTVTLLRTAFQFTPFPPCNSCILPDGDGWDMCSATVPCTISYHHLSTFESRGGRQILRKRN